MKRSITPLGGGESCLTYPIWVFGMEDLYGMQAACMLLQPQTSPDW